MNAGLVERMKDLQRLIKRGISGVNFNMCTFGKNECGTAACIAGTKIMEKMTMDERVDWINLFQSGTLNPVIEFARAMDCTVGLAYRISFPFGMDLRVAKLGDEWLYWDRDTAVEWLDFWIKKIQAGEIE